MTFGEAYGELPVPTRAGYIFGGWFVDEACTNAVTSESTVSTAGNHSLYAKWSADVHLLTFVFGSGAEPEVRSVNFGEITNYPATPVKEGYKFDGWNETVETMPAHDLAISETPSQK